MGATEGISSLEWRVEELGYPDAIDSMVVFELEVLMYK